MSSSQYKHKTADLNTRTPQPFLHLFLPATHRHLNPDTKENPNTECQYNMRIIRQQGEQKQPMGVGPKYRILVYTFHCNLVNCSCGMLWFTT